MPHAIERSACVRSSGGACGGRAEKEEGCAIVVAGELAPFRILYLEDPVAPESVEALRYVAQHIQIPIATGERFYSLHQFRELIDTRTVSLIRPDLSLATKILQGGQPLLLPRVVFRQLAQRGFVVLQFLATACTSSGVTKVRPDNQAQAFAPLSNMVAPRVETPRMTEAVSRVARARATM